MDVLERLKARLASARPRDLPPHSHRRAAVLIPVMDIAGEPHLILTKRTETVEHHKGQISFPGGRYEEPDPDLLSTALRETQEEIALSPKSVEVWGRLDEVETVVSGFAVTPYVGFVSSAVDLHPNPIETEQIIMVPLAVFLDPANLRVEQVVHDGHARDLLFYDYPPHVIWGATARIVKKLVDLLGAGEPEGVGR